MTQTLGVILDDVAGTWLLNNLDTSTSVCNIRYVTKGIRIEWWLVSEFLPDIRKIQNSDYRYEYRFLMSIKIRALWVSRILRRRDFFEKYEIYCFGHRNWLFESESAYAKIIPRNEIFAKACFLCKFLEIRQNSEFRIFYFFQKKLWNQPICWRVYFCNDTIIFRLHIATASGSRLQLFELILG